MTFASRLIGGAFRRVPPVFAQTTKRGFNKSAISNARIDSIQGVFQECGVVSDKKVVQFSNKVLQIKLTLEILLEIDRRKDIISMHDFAKTFNGNPILIKQVLAACFLNGIFKFPVAYSPCIEQVYNSEEHGVVQVTFNETSSISGEIYEENALMQPPSLGYEFLNWIDTILDLCKVKQISQDFYMISNQKAQLHRHLFKGLLHFAKDEMSCQEFAMEMLSDQRKIRVLVLAHHLGLISAPFIVGSRYEADNVYIKIRELDFSHDRIKILFK